MARGVRDAIYLTPECGALRSAPCVIQRLAPE